MAQTVDGRRAARRRQVAFAIFGTLVAAVLVASLGDSSAHKAYLAAKKTQETQIAGSWAVDHKHLDSTGVKAKDENKADVKEFMKSEQHQQSLSRMCDIFHDHYLSHFYDQTCRTHGYSEWAGAVIQKGNTHLQ